MCSTSFVGRQQKCNSRVLEEAENSVDRVSSESFSNGVKIKEGGSILEILEEMILGGSKHWAFLLEGPRFPGLMWSSGNSCGFLCAWVNNFLQEGSSYYDSDNFIALYGAWIHSYLESLITSWNGESLIMGDFNEVRCIKERWGSVFNSHGANAFNSFISNSGLNDIQLEGFSFTWAHPSATKMSKLDRFLMSNGLLLAFPLISAICLDRHLSDHRPILLKEVFSDFGPTPFRFYHSWLELPGFDDLVSKSWNSFTLDDSNGMIRFLKKLQMLKKEIRAWTLDFKRHQEMICLTKKAWDEMMNKMKRVGVLGIFVMAFKRVLERLLWTVKWSKVLASKKFEGLEFLVSSLSIGLFFSSGYGATFLMITPYGPELYQLYMA
ncbi:RNA-directed DNA polymerase, eukaryota [Tanacetum coccineum]